MKGKGNSGKILGIIISSLLALFFVFYLGYSYGVRVGSLSAPPSYIENARENMPTSVDFSLFWQTWNKARELYIGDSDPQEMIYGAISGMVSALGDPYSAFLKPSDNEKFSQDLSGQFDGIGAELTMQNGQIVVVAPLAGSPAEKAGVRAKDVIVEIDGTGATEMSLNQAVDKIRGKAGTQIKLKILRAGVENPLDFTITRESIKVESVTYKLEDVAGKKIAILKVSQFGDDTMDLAEKYAKEIVKDKASGVILDLRNNPGGYLDSSVEFANLFLEQGKTVVVEVDKEGAKKEYKTDKAPILKDYPTVVLANGGSASAAEIVTGALRDYKRAEIVGEKTFGKGSVQALEPLLKGAALKVTIAKWLTPLGTEINKVGITPDIVVALSDADQNAGRDPQLDKAKSEIISKIK